MPLHHTVLKNVTPSIQQRACSRVNSAPNTVVNASWVAAPPTPKPAARKVQYIGQGADPAALCVLTHDLRIRTHNSVDGYCSHGDGLWPHRAFVIARARARCAVVCSAP